MSLLSDVLERVLDVVRSANELVVFALLSLEESPTFALGRSLELRKAVEARTGAEGVTGGTNRVDSRHRRGHPGHRGCKGADESAMSTFPFQR